MGEPLEVLTNREREVFWLVADRLRNLEIAEQLFVSERTVESHVASLLRKLGGTDRRDLVAQAARLREDLPGAARLPRVLSSFVGRETDVQALSRLVARERLIALTGPAGVGKTRLAFHVADRAQGMPPPVLVDLATIPPDAPVERAFAAALGLFEDTREIRTALRDALREGRHWLILDNAEHVVEPCAHLLRDLVTVADGLHVLATSRTPLRVPGEVVVDVTPLDLPPSSDDPSLVLGAASARLFADRAASAAPGFTVTSANARDVATLCRRLDGLPLAIELAAARIRTFSAAELVRHLDDRFGLLTEGRSHDSGRHATLEDAVRWSHELLHDEERVLFERLSAFPGEFDYDTACDVAAHHPLDVATFLRLFPSCSTARCSRAAGQPIVPPPTACSRASVPSGRHALRNAANYSRWPTAMPSTMSSVPSHWSRTCRDATSRPRCGGSPPTRSTWPPPCATSSTKVTASRPGGSSVGSARDGSSSGSAGSCSSGSTTCWHIRFRTASSDSRHA